VLASLVLTVGCGGGTSEAPRSVLNLALKTSPNRLDPAVVVDAAEGELCALIFQGLVRFSPEGEVIPGAARAWRVENDGRRYVFEIDGRMRFSDGRAVTPGDVVDSFERVLAPQSRSSRRWVLDRIAGAEAFAAGEAGTVAGVTTPDDSTVVIELDEPFRPFLSMLALPAAMITAPRNGAPGGGDSTPIGSGRWMLAEWRRGDYVSVIPNPFHPAVRNPDTPPRGGLPHQRLPHPGLEEIRYRIIPEAFTRVAEFESGALDILEVPPAEIRRFLDDERYRDAIQSRSELRVFYVGLNNGAPPFDDVRVRRALNMAVDVDRLIDVLAGGEAIRAAGSIPPTLAGYAAREPYPFDPAAARRLLTEAGHPDGFAMEIWLRESPQGNRVLEAVQGYLAEVGVEVTLVRREWSAFKEAVSAGRVDAFLLDWFADYPDAENFLYPLFHSANVGGGGNRVFFRHDDVDRLIERASRTVEDAESVLLYARADSLVHERAPWIYLYFPKTFYAVSERVTGYRLPTLYLGHDFTRVRKTN
jgi:ABC-type transport system substrate-binding protein